MVDCLLRVMHAPAGKPKQSDEEGLPSCDERMPCNTQKNY